MNTYRAQPEPPYVGSFVTSRREACARVYAADDDPRWRSWDVWLRAHGLDEVSMRDGLDSAYGALEAVRAAWTPEELAAELAPYGVTLEAIRAA